MRVSNARLISVSLAIAGVALLVLQYPRSKPTHGQVRISNQPQSRLVGATSIAAGQPVVNTPCPGSVSTIEACVTPTTGTGPAAGIAVQSGTQGQRIDVMMTGIAMCLFDNTPVVMDVVTVVAGACHDTAGTVYTVSNLVGFEGRVTEYVDSSHAYVTMIHPAATGEALALSTLAATGTMSSSTFLRGDGVWSAGVSGATGGTGLTGATGIQGSTGATGVQGATGQQGATGSVGPSGNTGSAGSVGAQGVTGATGSQGTSGTSGNTGAVGATGSTGSAGLTYYLNGTLVSSPVKCGTWTGTTAANGTATISITSLGISSLIGLPTVNCQSSAACTPQSTASSASSVSILTQGGTTVSIVGINILSLSASALPYSMTVCGY